MLNDAVQAIQSELRPNEQILWAGRPKSGITLRPSDIVVIPISLAWGGCAVAWLAGVILADAPLFFTLAGVAVALAGLYFVFGRFFVDALQRARTYYALTTERIIIVSGLLKRNAKSLSLGTLPDIVLNSHANGTGTITFGPKHPLGWMYSGNWWPDVGQYAPDLLDMIDNARGVYDKIREAQKSS